MRCWSFMSTNFGLLLMCWIGLLATVQIFSLVLPVFEELGGSRFVSWYRPLEVMF